MAKTTKKAIFLSYLFRCKAEHLFFLLHKPEALQNWLAEKVTFDAQNKIYTFHWSNFEEKAALTELDEKYHILVWEWIGEGKERGDFIRFQVADTDEADYVSELIIEDFCDVGEEKEYSKRWDKLIHRLNRIAH